MVSEKKEIEKEEEDQIINVKKSVHSKLEELKKEIKNETGVGLTFSQSIMFLFDCLDEGKVERKKNFFKKGMGIDEKIED